jgi:hypothetical protein
LHTCAEKEKKKVCNDDEKIYMMQLIQISQPGNSFICLAGHGNVPEGVADKPFFFSSPAQGNGQGEAKEMKKSLLCDTLTATIMIHQRKTGAH